MAELSRGLFFTKREKEGGGRGDRQTETWILTPVHRERSSKDDVRQRQKSKETDAQKQRVKRRKMRSITTSIFALSFYFPAKFLLLKTKRHYSSLRG